MEVQNEELKETYKTIEKIIEGAGDEIIIKAKENFENDTSAYSLCDNYKSRRTKNVVIHMFNKNINILYYKEGYRNIIFINFLRLCQLNNLDVKQYHDLFLKYDIFSSIVDKEKYVNIFLKPIINNDKLLWDVNIEDFALYNLPSYSLSNGNQENNDLSIYDENNRNGFLLEEELKVKLNDLVENSSDSDISPFIEEENSISSFYSDSSESLSDDYTVVNQNIECAKEDNKEEIKSLGTYLENSNSTSTIRDLSTHSEDKINNRKDNTLLLDAASYSGHQEDIITNKNFVVITNKRSVNKIQNIQKDVFLKLNNINLNSLIDTIVAQSKNNKNNRPINTGTMIKNLDEMLIEKFVNTFEKEHEQLNNLHKKIYSMEQVIKYLMSEIAKIDMGKKKGNGKKGSHTSIQDSKEVNEEAEIKETQEAEVTADISDSSDVSRDEGVRRKRGGHSTCSETKKEIKKQINSKNNKRGALTDLDKTYFDSYNYTEIHRTMILDRSRTNCYYEFINKNKQLFENKIVLDIGCGSSIISLFCSDYAKVVVGIDNAEKILSKAKKIVEKNEAKNIYLFQGKLEDNDIYIDEKEKIYYVSKKDDIEHFQKIHNIAQLKILKFDIIISEWMGYFLFYECMINTILYARDIYLKEDGYIFPNKIYLYVAGYNDLEYLNENLLVWDKPMYNKDLSDLKPICEEFMKNAKIINLDKNKISTEIVNYAIINMYTYNKTENLYINTNFDIPIYKDKIVTSLCFYFDCVFETSTFKQNVLNEYNEHCIYLLNDTNDNILTTSVFSAKTHWKQVLLHLYCSNYNIAKISSVNSEKTNYLSGTIYISQANNTSRNVDVLLQIKKNKFINVNEEWTCYYTIE
ncbi:histone-arginine methyltransferase CARM1, putative [Plasmodium malariae]|uniref:Histone-arginine methyltransferase CARM1, putative n=1 Tax=Plasmodium malariae TaxID=5858 RepID=A0A1C3L2N8_PLAMA|nr:histone-arginine methyltransferase CARM1, putative [Plasmodium malariae]